MTIEQAKELLKKIESGVNVSEDERKLAQQAFSVILKYSIKKPTEV